MPAGAGADGSSRRSVSCAREGGGSRPGASCASRRRRRRGRRRPPPPPSRSGQRFVKLGLVRARVAFLLLVGVGAERLVELGRVGARVVERPAPLPVRQRQPGRHAHVLADHLVALLPRGVGYRGPAGHQVTAHAVDAEGRAGRGDPQQLGVAYFGAAQTGPCRGDLAGGVAFKALKCVGAGRRRPIMLEPCPDNRGPALRVGAGDDRHAQPEPVQQLRAQLPLLGVHGADEQEAGRVPQRDPFPLHAGAAGGRGVEQHVHDVVGQQVDLVDVEDAAVGQRQQARRERLGGARPGQHPGDVEAAGDVVVGGAERQLDQAGRPVGGGAARGVRAVRAGRVGAGRVAGEPALGHHADARQDPGQAADQRGLGGALLAGEQHAADAGVDGAEQQREPGVVLADDRHERQPGHVCASSSWPSTCRKTSRRASSVCSSGASQSPRPAASSSRSVMPRSAHGLLFSRNCLVSGSST